MREHRLHGWVVGVLRARLTDEAQIKMARDLNAEQKQFLSDWHHRGSTSPPLPPELRRKLQAMRGYFTRQLLDELRPLLADLIKKKSTKRRTR
jgi:hypothetical protein